MLARLAFMTGGAVSPDAEQLLDEGTHAVLTKPFVAAELLRFVAALAQRRAPAP
jgi:CheY-like chemotaxis protein